MKYLKRFNESLLTDILRGNIYQQIDDIDFDEFSETYGKEEFTDLDKRKIKGLVEKYLCQDKTPFEIESIESPDIRVVGQTINNYLQVRIKTGDIDYRCFIDVFKFSDDYFVLNLVIPVAHYTNVTDSKDYIVKQEEWYLIDGWDGFLEWATKTTPYNKDTEIFDLFTIPINDYKSADRIRNSLANTIISQYYTIRDWSKRTNYLFDDGFHFGTLVQKGREDFFYGDGTLDNQGKRKK